MNFPGSPSSREPTPTRPAPVQPGEEIAGKYRVGRVLGAGAMGVVVRAWHIELEQDVAVKFLHPELAVKADGAERFRREARSAVRIRSDHVARVIDVGTLEGSHIPFIVMEYLRGRDLARELSERGSLPVDEAARHVLEACNAVGEAHARGIVHRDLKPANLFLAERSGGGQMIKVLDFGISKTIGGGPKGLSITEPAAMMGSPGYMSPEQLECSRNVDARTDIWSLGVVLYEMVTGSLPFDGDSVPQLVRSVISGERASLAAYGAELAELEPVVARCLQQDRAQRFQTIAELSEALAPFAAAQASAPRGLEPAGVVGSKGTLRGNGGTGNAVRASAPTARAPAVNAVRGSAPTARVPTGDGARASAPPARTATGGAATGPLSRSGTTPDSAWGRTHGIGRAPLWRTLALAALIGAVGAVAFWRGRSALRTHYEQAERARLEVESLGVALQPLPAPSPAAEPAAPPEGAAGAPAKQSAPNAPPAVAVPQVAPLTRPASSVHAPVAPAASAPQPSPPAPVAPPRPAATSNPPPVSAAPNEKVEAADAFDLAAALGAATPGVPSAAAAASPVAPERPAAPAVAPAAAPGEAAGSAGAPNAPDNRTPPPAPPPGGPTRNPYEIPEFGGRK